MAALEVGALPYARGLINNQYRNYIRSDGQINYRAEETAQQARMLTILALYQSYSGGDDTLLLQHFDKAKAIADWLIARRSLTLTRPISDPRYGMMAGNEEGDEFVHYRYHQANYSHWYSAVAETYRAFTEIGPLWQAIGMAAGRNDVAEHGKAISNLAPLLYRDLHASMNKTANTSVPGQVCYSDQADPGQCCGCIFRSYSELFFSGVLTADQTESMYLSGQGVTDCGAGTSSCLFCMSPLYVLLVTLCASHHWFE